MNHYQQGFLAGLKKEPLSNNPLKIIADNFIAGVKAKTDKMKFTQETFKNESLSFREGYKSSEFAHLKAKGAMLMNGNDQWNKGHASGLNKANNVLAPNVHSAKFKVSVQVTAKHKGVYEPFFQYYTFEDHSNEVYRIEARHHYNLNSKYPNQEVFDLTPTLPNSVSEADIEEAVGKCVSLSTFNILQSASRSYQPITIKGINFLMRNFQVYIKLALNIPEWNMEANEQVDWDITQPSFTNI